ncbi:MAG: AAA family ATPase [Gammaproteobacteria bacterium]|nr:AAA family ATPase [Gammaproteobacteria bacterium]
MATQDDSTTKSPFDEVCDSMDGDGFAEEAPGSGGIPDPEERGPVYREWQYNSVEGGAVKVCRQDPGKKIRRKPEGVKGPFHPLDGFDAGKPIVVCEGEPACDALREAEINSTTGIGGAALAKTTDWRSLESCEVILWPDQDKAGHKAMSEMLRLLTGICRKVLIVATGDLPHKADAADVSPEERHWRVAQAIDIERLSEDYRPYAEALDEAEAEAEARADQLETQGFDEMLTSEDDFQYLVADLLPLPGLSLMSAKPKCGKSTLARTLAADVALGSVFLDRGTHRGKVLFCSFEESPRKMKKEFAPMGLPPDTQIRFVYSRGGAKEDFLPKLEATIAEYRPSLVIIDTLQKVLNVRDLNDYALTIDAIEPYRNVAESNACHIMFLHHNRKGQADHAADAVLGSTALTGEVDTILIMDRKADGFREVHSINRDGEDLTRTRLRFDPETRRLTLGDSVTKVKARAAKTKILEYIDAQGGWVKQPDIVKSEKEGGAGVRKGEALRLLKEMVQDGELDMRGQNPIEYRERTPG